MGNISFESDSNFCLCVHFSINENKLKLLNNLLRDEMKKNANVNLKFEDLSNRLSTKKSYVVNNIDIELYITSTNSKGIRNTYKKLEEEQKKIYANLKLEKDEIDKRLKGIRTREKRILSQYEEYNGYIKIIFHLIEKDNKENFLKTIGNLLELELLKIIEKTLKVNFLFSICSTLYLKKEDYVLFPEYTNISQLKRVDNKENRIGVLSINEIGWKIENSALGLTGLTIKSMEEIIKLGIKMCFDTKKISDIDDKINTTFEIASSIIKERKV